MYKVIHNVTNKIVRSVGWLLQCCSGSLTHSFRQGDRAILLWEHGALE